MFSPAWTPRHLSALRVQRKQQVERVYFLPGLTAVQGEHRAGIGTRVCGPALAWSSFGYLGGNCVSV